MLFLEAYLVGLLLILIPLLVRGSLGLVGSALLVVQCLPSLTKDLADLAYVDISTALLNTMMGGSSPKEIPGFSSRTFSRCSLAKNM